MQVESQLFFFQGFDSIVDYNVEERSYNDLPLKIISDFKYTSFRCAVHYKDIGKASITAESILVFSYH